MDKIFIVILGLLSSLQAGAWPMPTLEQELAHDQVLRAQAEPGYNYLGIVELRGCSGSLVRFHQSQSQDRAMILTNGHCVGRFPPPGEAFVGISSQRRFTLLKANGDDLAEVQADLLIYATMTRTDLGLYRLTQTFAEIEQQYGVKALEISSEVAPVSLPIKVISGYWRRGYSCAIDKLIYHLKEGDWTSENSIRYTEPGCEVIGGTSGSPILAQGTRVVVGVNNTGNESGERCTDNNPCEIDEKGNVDYAQGRNYGQQVMWLYTCLNEQREVDVRLDGCQLVH